MEICERVLTVRQSTWDNFTLYSNERQTPKPAMVSGASTFLRFLRELTPI